MRACSNTVAISVPVDFIRTTRSVLLIFGIAMAEMIKMMATTTSNSTRENPALRCFVGLINFCI